MPRTEMLIVVMLAACGTATAEPATNQIPSEQPEFLARQAAFIRSARVAPREMPSFGIELDLPADVNYPTDPSGQSVLMQGGYACTVELVADPPFRTPRQALLENLGMTDWKLRGHSVKRTADGWRLQQQQEMTSGSYPGTVFERVTLYRKVGATPIACSGSPACVDWLCARVRAIPEGPAETPHRTSTPALSVVHRNGFGRIIGGSEIWRDGFVHHHGAQCPTWRGREAKIDPASARSVIEAFDAIDPDERASSVCFDCETSWVQLRSSLRRRTIVISHIDTQAKTRALQLLRTVLGSNPCT